MLTSGAAFAVAQETYAGMGACHQGRPLTGKPTRSTLDAEVGSLLLPRATSSLALCSAPSKSRSPAFLTPWPRIGLGRGRFRFVRRSRHLPLHLPSLWQLRLSCSYPYAPCLLVKTQARPFSHAIPPIFTPRVTFLIIIPSALALGSCFQGVLCFPQTYFRLSLR